MAQYWAGSCDTGATSGCVSVIQDGHLQGSCQKEHYCSAHLQLHHGVPLHRHCLLWSETPWHLPPPSWPALQKQSLSTLCQERGNEQSSQSLECLIKLCMHEMTQEHRGQGNARQGAASTCLAATALPAPLLRASADLNKKKKHLYIFSSQLRADQVPGPPQEGQLM